MIAVMQDDLLHRHRITVEEYYRMAEIGLLAPEMRVELIEGEVIDMPPMGERHQGVVDRLAELLILAAGKRVTVRQQGPVRFDRYTELQPDFAGYARRCVTRTPGTRVLKAFPEMELDLTGLLQDL